VINAHIPEFFSRFFDFVVSDLTDVFLLVDWSIDDEESTFREKR